MTPVIRRSMRLVAVLAIGAIGGVALADAAGAHDPIFVDEVTAVEDSPLIEDGAISFATYGVIERPAGEAHVRMQLGAGQTFNMELLVPDRPPENDLESFDHLEVDVVTPDGATETFTASSVLDRFDEPFSQTSYLRLLEHEAPAQPGVTTVTVRSALPTRFTLATGRTEQFGTPVAEYERVGLEALDAWYTTPPATVPSTTVPSTTTPSTTAPDQDSGDEPTGAPDPGGQDAGDVEQRAEGADGADGASGAGSDTSAFPWPVAVLAVGAVAVVGVVLVGRTVRRAPR